MKGTTLRSERLPEGWADCVEDKKNTWRSGILAEGTKRLLGGQEYWLKNKKTPWGSGILAEGHKDSLEVRNTS